MPSGPAYERLRRIVDEHGLHTVCQEATCPNLGECWSRGTATIMIATVGFTNLETPRLWIPFMPLLIIGAATGQTRFRTGRSSTARFLALLAALQLAGSAIHWSFMDMRESETRIIEQRFFD